MKTPELFPYIRLAGDQWRTPSWEMRNRYAADYMLLLVFEGGEWLETGGERRKIEAGQGYLMQPGASFSKGADEASHCCWISFDLARDALSETRPSNHRTFEAWERLGGLDKWRQPSAEEALGVPLPTLLSVEFAARFGALAPRLVEWMRSPLDARRRQANLTFGAMLAEYACRLIEDRGASVAVEERIERAEEIAVQSLDTGFNVDAFAAAAGMRPSWFHETYMKLRGRTPKSFLLELRMGRAREYLGDASLSVNTVSRLVGYADATSFGRAFRREHGCSPLTWRERGSGR